MSLILQTHVGFLVVLWLMVRSADLALHYYPSKAYAWSVTYGILAVLLLIAALLSFGLH